MLSDGESFFDLRDVMDSGMILLLDLSSVSPEVRAIIGRLALSLLHLTALGRQSGEASSLRPFHVYCDDAHRFVTEVMEDLMAETRRFKVSLTLVHQCMSQFRAGKTGVLSSVGSTIMFRVCGNDAQHLCKDLPGKVAVDDLATLAVGHAVARIGGRVVRLRTLPPLEIPRDNCRNLIVQQSHERYYQPTR
jgi:hypothetical protein